jgi:hypothetical protein
VALRGVLLTVTGLPVYRAAARGRDERPIVAEAKFEEIR